MFQTDAQALREEAAKTARRRIAGDLEEASKQTAPLLRYISKHLFDEGLSYARLRARCGVRDNNRSTVFRREMGLTPAAYIRDCRFSVAAELLRRTNLAVSEVGGLVGYTGQNTFSAAFRRWAGMTPNAYRRHERALAAREDLVLPENRPDLSPAGWRRFVEGKLAREDADRLLRFFLDVYPESRRNFAGELLRQTQADDQDAGAEGALTVVPTLRSLFAREDIEKLMAEVVWEEIRGKPWNELDDLVRHHLRFTTRAFFDFLGEKYIEESRKERARGVEIARLALAAADAIEGDGAEVGGRGPMKALAWGWLGNAKRLAHDFVGADEAFAAARQRLPEAADLETGIVLSMLALLRRWQARFEEALAAADEAIPRLEKVGETDPLARTYLVRGIVHRELGNFEAAAHDNGAAAGLMDSGGDGYLVFSARYNQASCFIRAGSPAAAPALERARELIGKDPLRRAQVRWLDGLVAIASEQWPAAREALLEAREGFQQGGQNPAVVAVITLDLSLACLRGGDAREARALVGEALALFEALAFHEEAVAATVVRDEAREVTDRLAEILAGALTHRALRAAQEAAARVSGPHQSFSPRG